MRRRNLAFCYCTLLVIVSSSKPLKSSTMTTTSDNDRNNSTVRYQIHTNVTTSNRSDDAETLRYNARGNSTRSNDDVQYKLYLNSTSVHEDDDTVRYDFHVQSRKDHGSGDQTSMELRTKSTDDKINSTTHEPRGNLTQDVIEDRSNLTYERFGKFYKDDNKTNVVPYEMCENSTCISLCCPLGFRMKDQCVAENIGRYAFPGVYEQPTNESLQKGPIGKVDQIFQLTVHDPCQKVGRYFLDPDKESDDAFILLLNGSLYLPRSEYLVDANDYCLIVLQRDKYEIAVCIHFLEQDYAEVYYYVGLIISLPFLLTTFVVYSILPELQNIHGYTLRGYVGSLFVAYTFVAIPKLTAQTPISGTASCKIMAFILYFTFSASFFWLNVMCFDIWWTFGRCRSSQESVTRERKKFVMYSIYAWGSASILAIICAIMDFIPSVPEELIRPEFGKTACWFNTDDAMAIYFHLPIGVTLISNICLFTSTARKIVRQKKNTAAHLRSSDSRRHDDNKQWCNLYLKLFIVMGISSTGITLSMEMIAWLFEALPSYVWYLVDLINILHGPIIFIIFVWKGKIKRLLLKRFGCQDRGLSPETRRVAAVTAQPRALTA